MFQSDLCITLYFPVFFPLIQLSVALIRKFILDVAGADAGFVKRGGRVSKFVKRGGRMADIAQKRLNLHNLAVKRGDRGRM